MHTAARLPSKTGRAKDLLRFITCGSVDDGKSTLIGRLLHDSKLIFEDQLSTLAKDSARHGTTGDDIDFALLVDGLEAEREQGITIDVAYRFFTTPRRSFIVADTPGHEQYTRNMATGASNAELAVILIDARKGVLVQTRRHSLICSLLGIRHVVVAVNKIDLVDYRRGDLRAHRRRLCRVRLTTRLCVDRADPDLGPLRRQRHDALGQYALVSRPDAARLSRNGRCRERNRRRSRSDFRCNGSIDPISISAAMPERSHPAQVAAGDPIVVAGSGQSSRVKEIADL